jgi:tRNA threonylcarbamoyladenosine biosynthesis protein TsaB
MTRILAIETATEACSAALRVDSETIQRFEIAPRRHAALLLPFVESLLAEAGIDLNQVDAVAFGRGPGSFTGLRIAAGMAQGVAFGADLPVVPVSTLAALAQGTVREQGAKAVLAALDARMKEVYWGAFTCQREGLVKLIGEERVCAPEDVSLPPPGDWCGAGSGWETYADLLVSRCSIAADAVFAKQKPQAYDVAHLAAAIFERGGALPPEQAVPVYLRDKVANKPRAKV